jgi:TetR/AcrR family transcriptional repressor of nem operon
MRVDRRTMQSHHASLLTAAARLFRARGIASVSISEISRAAGLTHGAFYGHFGDKTVLAAEACRRSLSDGAARWRARCARARTEGRDPLSAIINGYLTERHRDAPEEGCALAALGPEIARAGQPLSGALDEGVRALLEVLEEEIGAARPELTEASRQQAALATLAALTGGLTLARAMAADPGGSRAALAAAASLARAAADPPKG